MKNVTVRIAVLASSVMAIVLAGGAGASFK